MVNILKKIYPLLFNATKGKNNPQKPTKQCVFQAWLPGKKSFLIYYFPAKNFSCSALSSPYMSS